ncbi:MAG: hypothetical protein WCC30_17545, partial [Candidatus Dormiibacterota bacterium]
MPLVLRFSRTRLVRPDPVLAAPAAELVPARICSARPVDPGSGQRINVRELAIQAGVVEAVT